MQDQRVAVHLGQGDVLGDYEIVSVAGSGGMGVVYKTTQRSLRRLVALKVIRDEIARTPEYRERFLREARLAASVDHPNVISVYDVGDQEGRLYLAMQWIEGHDLRRLLEQAGALPPDRAVAIAVQLAGAIDALHMTGLIHRDIKPANVVIRHMGASDHAYLTDFGVAKPAESSDQLTSTGWVVGTTGYISPEQIRGEEPGPRSDLYALGCLLFEALTGAPPFHGENEMALRWAHANDPRPAPSAVAPQLGERYDAFFATALSVEPSQRFFSGREFASALTAAHGAPDASDSTLGTAVSQHPPTAVGPATPMPVAIPPPQTSAGMAAQTPAGMYPAYGYVTPAPVAVAQPQRSGNPFALILLGIIALAGIAVGALAAAGVFSHNTPTLPTAQTVTAPATHAAAARTRSHKHAARKHALAPATSGAAAASAAPATAGQGTTSCGGGLSVGSNTSCGFAENVQQAYDESSGGPQTVTAYSPATGLNYDINCTGGTPHVCTGGTTHDASVYFISGPTATAAAPSAAAPAASAPVASAPVASTAGMHGCGGGVSGNGVTSCPFAQNVFRAYTQEYQSSGQPLSSVTAYSPVTNESYDMSCSTGGVTVSCTGAKGALVTFPMSAVQNS